MAAQPADQPAGGRVAASSCTGSPLVMKRAWSTVEVASAASWGWPATPPKWRTKVPTLRARRS